MRALKWAGGIALGAVLIGAGGVVALVLALHAGTFTPRIAAAIEGATGRAATLGAVSLRPGLTPRLVVEGASLANLPGGSRPEMARIRRLEVRVALLSLLRRDLDIAGIDLVGADILLERLPDGTPNWILVPAARPSGGTPAPELAAAGRGDAGGRLAIRQVRITDSRLRLPEPRLGTVTLAEATLSGIGTDGPARIAARLSLHGVAFDLDAEAVPAEGALRAALAAGANRLAVERGAGGTLRVTAALPEPALLAPILAALAPDLPPGLPLPPAEAALTLDAALGPTAATLRLGAADLSPLLPGLGLRQAELRAPAPDRPAELTLQGHRAGLDFRASATIETPGLLLDPAAAGPLTLRADLAAAGASVTLAGTMARPREAAGGAFDLRLAVPDLAALAPILPGAPPLTDLQAEARIEAAGALGGPLAIRSFRIDSPRLAAQGALSVEPGTPLGISGRIAADRVDLDGLGQSLARPAAPPPAATPSPAPAQPAAAPRLIPDLPLPAGAARALRGRIELSAAEVTAAGMPWRDLRAVIVAAEGGLRLEGVSLLTPGGALAGEAGLQAMGAEPALSVALRSEGRGLDLGALRRARGESASIEGHAEIRIEARGRGPTLRAVAATLSGEAGIAVAGGRIAGAGMQRLGPDLLGLLLPGAPAEGLPLRCLALRLSAEDGLARTQALFLETGAGQITGVAAVNLRTEALAARLLPDVNLFGVRVRAPVGIGGTLAAPRVGAEPGRALSQVVEDTVANRLWRDPTVEWLRGQAGVGAPAADCAGQLRLARFGAEGPVPPPERFVPGVPRELQGTTQDLLRGLGGILGGRR